MRVQWVGGYVLGFVLVGSVALGIVVSVYAVSRAAPALGAAIGPPPASVATLRLTLPAPPLLEWVQQRDYQARLLRSQPPRAEPAADPEEASPDHGDWFDRVLSR